LSDCCISYFFFYNCRKGWVFMFYSLQLWWDCKQYYCVFSLINGFWDWAILWLLALNW
jgi:hypothetical protein